MSSIRRINQAGVQLIKDWEGFHPKPYLTRHKMWAIGYGHTRTVRNGMEISVCQAEQFLNDDLNIYERSVQRLALTILNDNQFSALVSFALDIGLSSFERLPLLSLLNKGWYDQVPAQFLRWERSKDDKSKGFSPRRVAESRLWKTPVEGIKMPESAQKISA